MGILGSIFARRDNAQAGQYLPAGTTDVSTGIGARANAVLGRAQQIYQQNPKLVGGIALLGAAALLASIKRRS
ncbi:MAG: hypothetical protein ACXWG3_14395 [Usitatibacter sp.]